MATNLYAPPKARVADIVPGEAAPALWNPGAAASWSLLFTPAFGAFLHMKNWEALGEPDKAAAAKKWVVIYIAIIAGLTVVSVFLPYNRALPAILRLAGFSLLLGWYFASGKPQMNFVKSRYGKEYPRKEWGKPILIAFGALIGFGFVVGFIAGVARMASRHA
jgi:hypothetical protein